MNADERRYDLDWIRVIGMAVVFTHHVTMYFNPWQWHAKSSVVIQGFVSWNLAGLAWIMPLFFVISGLATFHALGRRSAGDFLRDRLLRLGVPVLVGAFLLSPFQIYSERITYGQFNGSFLSFLPRYFDGWYGITPDGNFAWMGLHTWYLLLLLIFTFVTLPLFLRSQPGAISRWFQATGPVGVLLLTPVLILALEGALFGLGLDFGQSGWPLGAYLGFYVIGFGMGPSDLFRLAVRKFGPVALLGALATTVPVAFIPEPSGFHVAFVAWQAAKVFCCWFWILSLFYLGGRYLNRSSATLRYWGEATMPFYMLHQPVIVGLGFALRNVEAHPAIFFPLFYVASFAITMVLYHGVARVSNPLRFLLGMKPRRAEVAARPPAA